MISSRVMVGLGQVTWVQDGKGAVVLRNCGGECCDVVVVEDVGHSDRVGCCSAVVDEGSGGGYYWPVPVQVRIQWLWVGSGV